MTEPRLSAPVLGVLREAALLANHRGSSVVETGDLRDVLSPAPPPDRQPPSKYDNTSLFGGWFDWDDM